MYPASGYKMRESWLERDDTPSDNRGLHFKGTVAKLSDLPWSSNIGDIYAIRESFTNYICYEWDGNEWVELA